MRSRVFDDPNTGGAFGPRRAALLGEIVHAWLSTSDDDRQPINGRVGDDKIRLLHPGFSGREVTASRADLEGLAKLSLIKLVATSRRGDCELEPTQYGIDEVVGPEFPETSVAAVVTPKRSEATPPPTPATASGPSRPAPPSQPLPVFLVYSHKDEALLDELREHLAPLRRRGWIADWHDRKIGAGREWEGVIDEHLEGATIVILLVSASFINSDYCHDREMMRALQRHEAGAARVIPVVVRSCDWHDAPFAKLQMLPRDAEPVTRWPDRDAAWTDVAKGIRAAAEEMAGHEATRSPAAVASSQPGGVEASTSHTEGEHAGGPFIAIFGIKTSTTDSPRRRRMGLGLRNEGGRTAYDVRIQIGPEALARIENGQVRAIHPGKVGWLSLIVPVADPSTDPSYEGDKRLPLTVSYRDQGVSRQANFTIDLAGVFRN